MNFKILMTALSCATVLPMTPQSGPPTYNMQPNVVYQTPVRNYNPASGAQPIAMSPGGRYIATFSSGPVYPVAASYGSASDNYLHQAPNAHNIAINHLLTSAAAGAQPSTVAVLPPFLGFGLIHPAHINNTSSISPHMPLSYGFDTNSLFQAAMLIAQQQPIAVPKVNCQLHTVTAPSPALLCANGSAGAESGGSAGVSATGLKKEIKKHPVNITGNPATVGSLPAPAALNPDSVAREKASIAAAASNASSIVSAPVLIAKPEPVAPIVAAGSTNTTDAAIAPHVIDPATPALLVATAHEAAANAINRAIVVKVATHEPVENTVAAHNKKEKESGDVPTALSDQVRKDSEELTLALHAVKRAPSCERLFDIYKNIYKQLKARGYLQDQLNKCASIKTLCKQCLERPICLSYTHANLESAICGKLKKFIESLVQLAQAKIRLVLYEGPAAARECKGKEVQFEQSFTDMNNMIKEIIKDYAAQTNKKLKAGLAQINPLCVARDRLILEACDAQRNYNLSVANQQSDLDKINAQYRKKAGKARGKAVSKLNLKIGDQSKLVIALKAKINENQQEIQGHLKKLIALVAHTLMKETDDADHAHIVLLDKELLKSIFDKIEQDVRIKKIFFDALSYLKGDLLIDIYYILQNYLEKLCTPLGRIESKGHVWEVAVGFWLYNSLKQEVRLNQHCGVKPFTREFDVVLPAANLFFECKNITWPTNAAADMGKKLQKQFVNQSNIVKHIAGHLFAIISYTKINQFWRDWLKAKAIFYFDPEYSTVIPGIKHDQVKKLNFASLYNVDYSSDTKSDGKNDE